MTNVIDEYLRNNLWANPKGDWQFPIMPELISPSQGYRGYFILNNTRFNLPDNNSYYNAYSAGRLNPELIRLLLNNNMWTSFDEIINNYNMYSSAYTDDGITLLRSDVYYAFGKNKTLIILVRRNNNFNLNYENLNIGVRFYAPVYLEQNQSLYSGSFSCVSKNITNNQYLNDVQTFYNSYPENSVSVFINGYLNSINNVTIGSSVDIIYDPVYKSTYSRLLNTLPVFYSNLDKSRKYLFHIDPENINEIDFISNIDFYLIGYNSNSSYGLYLHRNIISNIRNVSFHDYSIETSNVQNLMINISNLVENPTFEIVAKVRKSPFGQNLLNTDNDLLNLYKIQSDKESLFAGKNSVSIFNASNLESSDIMQYVSSYQSQLDQFNSLEVAGYNSITNAICSPLVNVGSEPILIPECFTPGFTAFEFSNGLLNLTSSNSNNGSYSVINSTTDKVLFLNGVPTNNPNDIYKSWLGGNISISTQYDYRVYGFNGQNWLDVTNEIPVQEVSGSNILSYINGYEELLIKTSEYIYVVSAEVNVQNTALFYELNDPYMEAIPYGALDVFLNGYYLNYLIDYILIGNIVYITNLEKININNINNLLIVGYSFCNQDLSIPNYNNIKVYENLPEFNNDHYYPHITIVNNQIYDNQTFTEPYYEVNNKLIPVSLRYFYNLDTLTLLEDSLENKPKMDVMESLYNEFKPIDILPNKKPILSVFLNTILNNAIQGEFNNFIYTDYSKSDILFLLFSWSKLFSSDPLFNDDILSEQYEIFGTFNTIDVNKYVYDFFVHVLEVYKSDKLNYFGTVSNLNIKF